MDANTTTSPSLPELPAVRDETNCLMIPRRRALVNQIKRGYRLHKGANTTEQAGRLPRLNHNSGSFCRVGLERSFVSIAGIPLFSMLKTRMHWHEARQRVLAENVANADTPNFKARDVVEPGASQGSSGSLAMIRTSNAHLAVGGDAGRFDRRGAQRFETRPSGNAVVLEDEMMKAAQNQSDYQMAVTLYAKGLALLKTAVGRG
jgi:flagellar basal-body rod protein FlgB